MSHSPASDRALRIGLSARLMHQPPAELGFPGKTLQYLEQSIAHWVMSRGAVALMVPTLEAGSGLARRGISVAKVVAALDGLVLQGGTDVSPISYGEDPISPLWSGDRVRDLYEIELLWEFIIQGKPVLGICRGCQLINVAMGGTLYQDIGLQHPGARDHVDAGLYDRLAHTVEIMPESRLAALYGGQTQGRVNSIHHQAVNRLGNDLVVEARCPDDGIVEAIRWKGAGYVAGFQWHPEFHAAAPDLLDNGPILLDFLAAAAGGDPERLGEGAKP